MVWRDVSVSLECGEVQPSKDQFVARSIKQLNRVAGVKLRSNTLAGPSGLKLS